MHFDAIDLRVDYVFDRAFFPDYRCVLSNLLCLVPDRSTCLRFCGLGDSLQPHFGSLSGPSKFHTSILLKFLRKVRDSQFGSLPFSFTKEAVINVVVSIRTTTVRSANLLIIGFACFKSSCTALVDLLLLI